MTGNPPPGGKPNKKDKKKKAKKAAEPAPAPKKKEKKPKAPAAPKPAAAAAPAKAPTPPATLPPLRAAGAVSLKTKVAARRAALEGKSVAGASTLKAKVEARKVALGLGTSAPAAAAAAPPAAGTKGSKAAASASSGGAGSAVAVPAGSLVCTTTAGTPAWCVRAVEVAAGVGGQSVAFVGAEGRSAAITLSVDGVVLRGAEAVVSYLLDAGGVSIAFGVPAVQHWLGWRAAAADSGADAKAVGKTLESSITASGGFLAGGSVTSADIVVAAWAAGTTFAAGKLPKAVQAWVESVIGDAPVAASPAKAKTKAKAAASSSKGEGGGSAAAAAGAAAAATAVPAAKVPSTHGTWGTTGDRYYVTTAINYTNGDPHCGHAYEGTNHCIL